MGAVFNRLLEAGFNRLLEAVFNRLLEAVSNRLLAAVTNRFVKPSVFEQSRPTKKLYKTYGKAMKS